MEQRLPQDNEPTKEELIQGMHQRWRYNQYGAKLDVNEELGAIGSVKPEVKHEPKGEWQGKVEYSPEFYQLVNTDQGDVTVTVSFHHLPSRPVAQANVENAIATVYLGQPQETTVERDTRKVG